MNEREKILLRIREALQLSAPMPGSHEAASAHSAAHEPRTPDFTTWLPDPGADMEQWIALFDANSVVLKTEVFHAAQGEVPGILRSLAEREAWQRVATHRSSLLDAALAELPVEIGCIPMEPSELEKYDAGITGCDALVAQTGSVLVTTQSAGGRALSVLPPHHVVIARRQQMVADLPAAMRLIKERYAAEYPSYIGFITGPSRTGDIERILVLGAHGPKKLTVIITTEQI